MIFFEQILYPKYYCKKMLELKEELDRRYEQKWKEEAQKRYSKYNEADNPKEAFFESWENRTPDPEWEELREKSIKLNTAVKQLYFKTRSKDGILEDVELVVNSFEKEDYTDYVEFTLAEISSYREAGTNELFAKDIEKRYEDILTKDFEGCFHFIIGELKIPLEAFVDDEIYTNKVAQIVRDRVALWYEEPEEISIAKTPLSFAFPRNYLQNVTKANLTLFDRRKTLEELKQISVEVTPSDVKNRGTITYCTYVDLSAPELKGTENITEYDESVQNAVASVVKTNTHGLFTAKQVATHLYHGGDSSHNPSPQQIGAVTKSIEKQRFIKITIDWTEHARLNGLPEDASYTIENYMLPVKAHIMEWYGQKVTGYQLLDTPPLFEYGEAVKQIATHPVAMLNVPVNLDEQKLIIRDYLLKEIAHIRKSSKWNRTITLDRILEKSYLDPNTNTYRVKKSRLLEAIRKMLEYWASNNYITYTENIQGKSTVSFTINPVD